MPDPIDTSKLGPVRIPPPEEFEQDFKDLMVAIRRISAKHNLPTPVLVFEQPWMSPIKRMALVYESSPADLGPRKFMDVKFTYGRINWEMVIR